MNVRPLLIASLIVAALTGTLYVYYPPQSKVEREEIRQMNREELNQCPYYHKGD